MKTLGSALFLVLGLTLFTSLAAAADIRLTGCEFSVRMPENAIRRQVQSQFYSYEQVRAIDQDGVLQAECLPVAASEDQVRAMVLQHAVSTGGHGVSISRVGRGQFEARYYKTIDGIVVTYLTHIHVGQTSTMVATGGIASTKFPSNRISTFHRSIKR